MPTILTELGGFTPVLDVVTDDVGLMASILYGLVWRHCQMEDRVCKKSLPALAEMLKVNERTVRRHMDKLCERGYVKDLTPDLKNKPHVYVDTGKVKIAGKIEAALDPSQNDRALTKSQGDKKSGRQIVRACPDNLTGHALTNCPMSKTLHEETFKETHGAEAPRAVLEDGPKTQVMTRFLELTGLKMPNRDGDVKFWWSSVSELLHIANDDPVHAMKLIGDVVAKMRGEGLTIASPKSLINPARALAASSAAPARNGAAKSLGTDKWGHQL